MEEWKTATVRHMTAWAVLRKCEADGFLLDRQGLKWSGCSS